MNEDRVDVEAVKKYLLAQQQGKLICKECGRINPSCNFECIYTLAYGGGFVEISGYTCLDCDKEIREKLK